MRIAAYYAYQARIEYIREQRAIQLEIEESKRNLAEERKAKEEERKAKEEERKAKEEERKAKDLAAQSQDGTLPSPEQFQLYAVATLYPQALATEMDAAWQPTTHSGVYHLFTAGLKIIVIVTAQIPAAPHNRPWNLLSNDPTLIRYAMEQQALPPDLQRHFESFV